jgi:sortase A
VERAQTAGQGVDFGLWSEKRIEAYKQLLSAKFEAPIALLTIRRLSLEVPVFEGTEEPVLNRGVGWILDTAKPGEGGNIGIAGHRDGFFRCLKDIQIGDRIELATPDQKTTYTVDAIQIVIPEDVSVLLPRKRPALTLVTCYPFYFIGSAPMRFIVHASIEESDLKLDNNAPNSESRTTNKQEVTK